MNVSICGSWNRFLTEINDVVQVFKNLDCKVLSPTDTRITSEREGFVYVESDVFTSIKIIENKHLKAMLRSDLIWLVAPTGYVGSSAALEIGYALAHGKPVYCSSLLSDSTLRQYVSITDSPISAIAHYENMSKSTNITPIKQAIAVIVSK